MFTTTNILIAATIVFIVFWLYWLLGMMAQPQSKPRKPVAEPERRDEPGFAPRIDDHSDSKDDHK